MLFDDVQGNLPWNSQLVSAEYNCFEVYNLHVQLVAVILKTEQRICAIVCDSMIEAVIRIGTWLQDGCCYCT
jgi:hypothetical protein